MMMGTSDEIGGGGGGPANFLFENQTRASVFNSINSDNSGGVCSTGELHKNTTSITYKKLIDSTSTSPTLTPTPTPTPTPTAVTPPELVVGQTTSTGHQKRNRGGAKSSARKGTSAGGGDWNDFKVGGESDHEIHIWTEREIRKKMRNMFSYLDALFPQLPAKEDKSTIVDEAVDYIKTLPHSLQKLQKQRIEMRRGGGPTLRMPAVIDYEPSSSSLVVASNSPTLNTREALLTDQVGPSSASLNNNSSSSMINENMTFSSLAPNNSLSVVPCINIIPSTFHTWSSPNVALSVNGDDAQISVCAPRKPGILTTCCYVLEKHKLEVVTTHVSSDCYRSMFMIHAHVSSHYMLSYFLFFCR
ncbi:hypothetical protein MKX03_018768 [Papaver bracteatum]|nr:hypothetical protein MKX03_018768 [Papaver bracteatum]